MNILNSRIIDNWILASKEFGFKIQAPYILQKGEEEIYCVAYLPDFGSKNGMIIDIINPPDFIPTPRLEDLCSKMNLFYSSINSEIYSEYLKDSYIEALIDWGYFGDNKNKPNWIE